MKEVKRVRKPFKAYKAFDENLKCRSFQYKVGSTYQHKGSLVWCRSGFHACRECADIFNYYSFDPRKTRVCEVIVKGRVIEEDDKLCCSKIEIVRELEWSEVLSLCNVGIGNSGHWNSGNRNSGNRNSGNRNSGDNNSGNWNSGNSNSGYRNSGSRNSGNWNSGIGNSGIGNSGIGNSGIGNSGSRNSGNWNSGDNNSGHWNACIYESGFLNTETSDYIRVFNKPCKRSVWESARIPNFFYFDLTEWVEEASKVEGGYLKTYSYKEAWQRSWDSATEEDRRLVEQLPNFDWEIFTELTGIEKPENWD